MCKAFLHSKKTLPKHKLFLFKTCTIKKKVVTLCIESNEADD